MKKIRIYLTALVLLTSIIVVAQPSKVETVRMILEDTDPNAVKDLRECKRLIDEAKEHSKTSNSPKMWVYRGAVYYEIARKNDELSKENPDAIVIAAESLFKCKESDTKKSWQEQCDFYLLNVANVMFNLGVAEYQAKNYDKSIFYYTTTLRIIPYDTKGDLKTINITDAIIYQYCYYAAMAKGDNALTKQYINKLIDLKFNDPKIYNALARVQLDEKDTAAALQSLADGRNRFPNDIDLMNMELDIYLKQGKTDLLLEKLNAAIEADAENKIYYFARASTFEKIQKWDEAEKDYKKALEIDPDYYDASFNLGVLYVNKARPIIDKLTKTYKKDEQTKLETQISEFYIVAIKYFEKCYQVGVPGDDKKEKFELLESLQRLYKNIGNKEKEEEYKKLKDEL
ncbi:MAG: tetratricopeptide repeat protein [Bacteroidetes bacterium]|nr:tetratricopeptide repeat protein [Bacteroidota bacterium]